MPLKIFHAADIHIAPSKHERIAHALAQLHEFLRAEHVDVLVICGDVFENKTTLSGTDISLWYKFIAMLDTWPGHIVTIPGNHDCGAGTDLLSCINPQHARYEHFAHSGTYVREYAGRRIAWHVCSPLEYPTLSEFKLTRDYNILLLHEAIREVKYSNGIVDRKARFHADDFAAWQLVLAGDIHRRQHMRANVAYCGSFIQKTRSENLQHGGILWTIDTSNGKIISRNVDFSIAQAYVVVRVTGKKIIKPDWAKIYSVAEYQLRYKSAEPAALAQARDILQTRAQGEHILEYDCTPAASGQVQMRASNLEIQIQALQLRAPDRDDIITMHKEYMQNCSETGATIWQPCILRWSNLYRYGQDNVLDFNNLQQINSICGRNMTGKSSIIDIFNIALYNTTLRGSFASAINNAASKFNVELEFTAGTANTRYKICREYTRQRATSAQLYTYSDAWVQIELTSMRAVYDRVAELVGSADIWYAICVRAQNAASLLDMTPTNLDRVYAACFDFSWLGNVQSRVKADLKTLRERIAQIRGQLSQHECKHDTAYYEDRIARAQKRIAEICVDAVQPLRVIDDDANALQAQIAAKSERITQFSALQPAPELDKKKILGSAADELRALHTRAEALRNELAELPRTNTASLPEIDTSVVKKFAFSSTCDACCKNEKYVASVRTSSERAQAHWHKVEKRVARWHTVNEQLNTVNTQIASERARLQNLVNAERERLQRVQQRYEAAQTQLPELQRALESEQARLQTVLQNEDKLRAWREQQLQRRELLQERLQLQRRCDADRIELQHAQYREEYEPRLQELLEQERVLRDYKTCIEYKGIARSMSNLHLRVLLVEMNNMLSYFTNFKLEFDKDNNAVICDADKKIPGALASGYQKFIIDLVIRIVLLRNSSMPKILIIDEGFGCMDENHLQRIREYLESPINGKSLCKMLFISHLNEISGLGQMLHVIDHGKHSSLQF